MKRWIAGLAILPLIALAAPVIDQARSARWACTQADGAVLSEHDRQDTALLACQNRALADPGTFYFVRGASYRISATVDSLPAPDPDPVPDPDPTPDPDPPPVPPTEWSNYRGIPDPSQALGFAVYADYPVDQTLAGGSPNISASGTAADPHVADCGGATLSGLGVSGDYVIVQNCVVRTTGEGPVRSGGSYVVFRDIDVGGNNSDHGHGSAVGLGPFNVWLRGAVHNFGVINTDKEQDQHGFKVMRDDVWILDVETYALSGDGVQVGDASRGDANRVYIGGGYYHDNRENAVDVKDSTDVVISGIRMENFFSVGSSHGEAIVLHDDCYNTKVFDNVIVNANLGIVSSGKSGHLIDGNTIQANSVGIQLRNTRPITVTNNVIDAPLPVEKQGGLNSGDNIQDR